MIEFFCWYIFLPYVIMGILYLCNLVQGGRTKGDYGGYYIPPLVIFACAPITVWLLMWETIFMFVVMFLVSIGVIE